jgi:hypothetical protein
MFVLLPVFALLMKGVYRSHLYFNHLIFAIHLHTIGYLVLALMLPLEGAASLHLGLMITQVVLLVAFLVYFVAATKRVYESSWLMAASKSLAVLFGYMIVVSIAIENTSTFLIIAD